MTKADGTKFGKTETGTVWLDRELTSPYAFYQFWFNTDDRDVMQLVRFYTFRTPEELAALAQATSERPYAREAQRALAEEVTTLVHGAEETRRVQEASKALFGQGELALAQRRTPWWPRCARHPTSSSPQANRCRRTSTCS